MNSIRHRLLVWQIGALIVTGVIVSGLTFQMAWNGFNRIRDYGLEQIAYSVIRHGVKPLAENPQDTPAPAPVPSDSAAPETSEAEQEAAEDLGRFVSQIWRYDGEILYSSHNSVGPPMQTAGFHVVLWDGELWRVYTIIDSSQVVQVAVTSNDRASHFAEMIPWLMVPLALLVVVLGLLIHTAVIRALVPLEQMGSDIGARQVTELHPVSTEDLPDELVPLGSALNQLLGRVDTLLAGQRQFVANAAHELNTPLAAVKLQAQLARRVSDAQRQSALDELDQGIERATHLVAQLLQMARLEPDVRQRHPQRVRLDEMAAKVVAAFSAQAEARDIDLGLDSSDMAWVFADPAELRVMMDNLVDNALRHTPAGSRVDVRVRQRGETVELIISDNGPGIAEEERQHVLQRFVRLNPQDSTGSGLGLAIVAQIVKNKSGELALQDTPGGGLCVCVGLPAWQDPPA
jgi:two-component system OmpR family sensor kinase